MAFAVVEQLVDQVELRAPHLPSFSLADPAATIATVERSRFDLALVDAAAEARVDVRDGLPVRELVEHEGGIDLQAGRERWRVAARLRAALGPALDRLGAVARVAEPSITGAVLGAQLSRWVRERAVAAIAGRRTPFVIDGDRTLACTCERPGDDGRTAPPSGFALASPAVGHGRPCAASCVA